MPIASDWRTDNPGISWERLPGSNRAIGLSHPAYPFEGIWAANEPQAAPKHIPKIACDYLKAIAGELRLPSDLFKSDWEFKRRTRGMHLTWLSVASPSAAGGAALPPRDSVTIRRYGNPATPGTPTDRTVVFLAVQSSTENDPDTALGSRLGIRVIAHVSPANGGNWAVRITGMTCSALLQPSIDNGDPDFSDHVATFVAMFLGHSFRTSMLTAATLGPGYRSWFDGIRVLRPLAQDALFELYLNTSRPANTDDPLAPAYALTYRIGADFVGNSMAIESVQRHALVAHAAVKPDLFRRDPPSKDGLAKLVEGRPNRAPERLQPFLERVTLPRLNKVGQKVVVSDGEVDVKRSRLVEPGADEGLTEEVLLNDCTHSSAKKFGALSAYLHASELFDRLRACGFLPAEYFRAAALPLVARYRAPIRPGPGGDGKTINAQVNYEPCGCDPRSFQPKSANSVQVSFALADMKRSSSRRQPLSLAADARWNWHEFAHVLQVAATGALELRFAHSVGDALAAIISDPSSELAKHARMRGATFPWVYLNRRHDRQVSQGWSWCGTHHRQARFPTDGDICRHKGYLSEQILSTSLFRLYRVLGGDSEAKVNNQNRIDIAARQAASDYTVYLILRAIWSLGAASEAPVETPSGFVAALIDADIATMSGGPNDPLGTRVGGCAHKAVRWAFEAQGLYASSDWNDVVNAPGKPPAIDVYIDNGRPDAEGPSPRGGYMPVSLDWETATPPRWHADRFIRVDPNGVDIHVDVSNRGQIPAVDATVKVWYAERTGAAKVAPDWNAKKGNGNAEWTPAPGPNVQSAVNPAATVPFGPFTLPSATKRYWVLAAVSATGDLANTDPATGLPCASVVTPVVDLVAGDNNLGLINVR
jgi:hypothetical protein